MFKCKMIKRKVLPVLLLPLLLTACSPHKAQSSFTAMDTFMTIQATGKNPEQALAAAHERVMEIEGNISTTLNSSDVYRLNHGEKITVSQDTRILTTYGLNLAQQTQGALNPALYPVTSAWGFTTGTYTVPTAFELSQLLPLTDYTKIKLNWDRIELEPGMALDFGALGKGYAGDEIVRILKERGITSALLDLGGNVQALGKKNDGTMWNIGIRNPWGGSASAALKIADQAVITSGGYERFFIASDGHQYIHIIDSNTGYPVENGVVSVTIVAESGLYADGLSTGMFVMGLEKASDFWKQHKDFEMIIFTQDHNLYYTEGLVKTITVLGDFNSVNIIH
ncbi:MAG: FAD:protein FMN transferase [Treponema sp.]|nr:FAD:protein FMN transferase [Treponema sp.]